MNHTPGPWIQVMGGLTVYHEGLVIASVGGMTEEEAQDNARLIAAAPDMLEALRGLLPMWESGISEPWVIAARAAIAKATGASTP